MVNQSVVEAALLALHKVIKSYKYRSGDNYTTIQHSRDLLLLSLPDTSEVKVKVVKEITLHAQLWAAVQKSIQDNPGDLPWN